ncbi:MAG: Holliday junction branch migration protein RuvA [Bacteroidia bacterium]|nr:Holliday junction branch migration protein RuvA [Bacteroidia bacterium]MDW8235724.1 Holliday junction branch migration protein RuvA [Bacteroidia bacterium]
MLTLIRGRVASLSPHQVIIDIGNIGIRVQIPLRAYEYLKTQEQATLHTLLWMPREEGEPTLYGFLEEDERELFLRLLKVPHLGPQKALLLLSHFTPAQLITAIQVEDSQALTRIKGIGSKLAERIVLEMRELIKGLSSHNLPPTYQDAYEGLLALGFAPNEAQKRLQTALQREPDASAERLIQLALSSSS